MIKSQTQMINTVFYMCTASHMKLGQKIGFPLQKRTTHVNNAYNVCTGRREEQREDWRWAGSLKEQTGRQNARAEMQ